jgi:hypothetical protein
MCKTNMKVDMYYANIILEYQFIPFNFHGIIMFHAPNVELGVQMPTNARIKCQIHLPLGMCYNISFVFTTKI